MAERQRTDRKSVSRLRRAGKIAGIVVGALLACVVIVFALLQTDYGRRTTLGLVESLATSDEFSLKFGTLSGSVPFDMRLSRVEVGDRDGVWLTVDDVKLTWRALPLFVGHVAVEEVAVEKVSVMRLPAPSTAPEEPETDEGGGGIPVTATIDKLDVGVVSLHEGMPGGPASFGITGHFSANDTQAGLVGEAIVTRFDEPGGKLSATFAFDPRTTALNLDATISDPSDGFVAALFGRPGMPRLELEARANGTLDELAADLTLTAGGERAFGGTVEIRTADQVRHLAANFDGDLTGLVPTGWEALLGGAISLVADADLGPDGAVTITRGEVRTVSLTADLSGNLGVAGSADALALTARLGGSGTPLTLPAGTEPVVLDDITVEARVRPAGGGLAWRLAVEGAGLKMASRAVKHLALSLDGTADAPHLQEAETIPVVLAGAIEGVDLGDPKVNTLIGETIKLSAEADARKDGTVTIKTSAVHAAEFVLSYAGTVSGSGADGRVSLFAEDLTRISDQAGQPLSGKVDIAAEGEVAFSGAPIALRLDGRIDDLKSGIAVVDGLLGGQTTLAGGIARNEEGLLLIDKLKIAGTGMTVNASGTLTPEEAGIDLDASLNDLSRLNPQLAGLVQITARLEGAATAPDLRLSARGGNVYVSKQPLAEPRLELTANLAPKTPKADLTFDSKLGELPLKVVAKLVTDDDGTRHVEGFQVVAGHNTAEGAVTVSPDGVPDGHIALQAPDLSELAPLAMMQLAGAVAGRVTMSGAGAEQKAEIRLTVKDVHAPDVAVKSAAIDARVDDPLGQWGVDGTVQATGIAAGGTVIDRADIRATPDAGATMFDVTAKLPEAAIATTARFEPAPNGFSTRIDKLTANHGKIGIKLAQPTTVRMADGNIDIANTLLTIGNGRITLGGVVADTLNLAVDVKDLPLTIVNAVAPGTGAGGVLNASAKVSGRKDAPSADWRVNIRQATAAAAKEFGIPALSLDASGRFSGTATSLDARVGGVAGLDIRATGNVPTAPTGALDIAVNGSLPFSLIAKAVDDAGASLSGGAKLALKITGPAGSPAVSGTVTTAGATVTHVDTGTVIRDLTATIGLTPDQVKIEKLSGHFARGGTISAGGSLNYKDPALPADLHLTVRDGRYVDGTLVAANFEADLKMSGPLATAPQVGGRVTINRAEINIPENIPGGAQALGVKHTHAPKAVLKQEEIIAPKEKKDKGSTAGTLDLVINAPARIFIRGRGLDAELGGTMTMRGPLASPVVEGGFSMRRGRLDLLSRRLDFSRGVVRFGGDFDPLLDFFATTKSDSVSINIAVTGSASAPEFAFTSSPELPQDEVISRFLFDRGIDKLSGLQVAQLAASVATLTGKGGGPGALDRLRSGIGIDRLDVGTDDKGKTQVEAGKYVADGVYVGVKQGTGKESTKVTIDLDVTQGVKARGEVGNDGETKAGIFFERDY